MSWLLTFGIIIGVCIFAYLSIAFIDGIFEWSVYSEQTWKAYFSLIIVVILFIVFILFIHHIIVISHLCGC